MNHRLLLVLCVSALSFIAGGCHGPLNRGPLDQVIRDLNYTPVPLPSGSYRPGKLMVSMSVEPFQGSTVCEYGSYIGSPVSSKDLAASVTASQKLTGTFDVGAQFADVINAEATYNYVKDISVTLGNVSVEEVSDDKVFEGLKDQTPGCTSAIKNFINKERLGFLQNALKADALYTITFSEKASVDASAKQEALKKLALHLGASPDSVTQNQIAGKNLYWGVFPLRTDLAIAKDPAVPVLKPLTLLRSMETSKNSDDRNSKHCDKRSPCSPDGKWFAAITELTLEAKPGQELRSAQVHCSGDGCPWREVLSIEYSPDGQKVTAKVKTWSISVALKLEAQLYGRPE